MADATTRAVDKFDDPKHWDEVIKDVPIFRGHDMWRKKTKGADGKESVAYACVPRGTEPDGDGWEFAYSVTDDTLHDIKDEINREWQDNQCPVKLFAGHTKDPSSQVDQPPLVGYGPGGAYVGKWGPNKEEALFLKKMVISKGYGDLARELPERSPEFHPMTNRIRGVALLKTNPRLSMGMTLYQRSSDGIVCYAMGVDSMPLDPTKMPPSKEQMADKKPLPDDATEVVDEAAEPDDEGFKTNLMKYMAMMYPKCHAMDHGEEVVEKPEPAVAMGHRSKQSMDPIQKAHRDIMQTQIEKLKRDQEEFQYGFKVAECKRIIDTLVNDEGYEFSNPGHEIELLVKMGEEDRNQRIDYIRKNYRQSDYAADPTRGGYIDTEVGQVGGSTRLPSIGEHEMSRFVKYAEEHNLDMDDNEQYEKAVVGFKKATKVRR